MKKIKAIILLPLAIILLFASCNTAEEKERRIYSIGSPIDEELFDSYGVYTVPLTSDFGQDPLDPYISKRFGLVQTDRILVMTPEGLWIASDNYVSPADSFPGASTSTTKYHFGGRPVAGDMGLTFGLTINSSSFGDTIFFEEESRYLPSISNGTPGGMWIKPPGHGYIAFF